MSLGKWINEHGDPTPGGDTDFGLQERWAPHPALVVLCALMSAALLVGAVVLLVPYGWAALGALFVYLVIAILVRPDPDIENLGYMNGMIDNPLRLSDDLNWWRLIFKVVLLPGRFVGESFRAFAYLGEPRPMAPPHDEV